VELILVRHARPYRVENVQGPADPSLDPEGLAQAALLAEWLADEEIDAVYASPLRRAIETAEPLVERLGLQMVRHDGVVEWDRDSVSYIPTEELKAENHEAWAAMRDDRWDLIGIDPDAFRARVGTAMAEIAAAHPSQRVAVVCHGGVINTYTGAILGLDRMLWFEPRYTSMTRVLVHRRGQRSILTLNESPHLPRTGKPGHRK
jgi:probable phosphoglycerate mutase